MKIIIGSLSFLLFASSLAFGQCDPAGDWMASIKIQNSVIELGVHIDKQGDLFSGYMISPDQTVEQFSFDTVFLTGDTIRMQIKKDKIKYTGILSRGCDSILGTWKQGKEMALVFHKVNALPDLSRPQEPHPPFPYKTEEVSFVNKKAKIRLSGTLTYPEGPGPFPAVILISGSGAQNRDEELLGHKPFLVIADHLTRQGFAVLRFDDRGTGKSEGDFSKASSFDFAEDVDAAFSFLCISKQIDPARIGLIGHSEGGMIAPILASKNKRIGALVLLAGPGTTGKQILISQAELIGRVEGADETELQKDLVVAKKIYQIIETGKNKEKIAEQIRAVIDEQIKELSKEEIEEAGLTSMAINAQIQALTSDWFITFVRFDPSVWLKKVSCPVLALNGEKDLQVPAKENLTAIEYALAAGKCSNFETLAFPDLNHLFQHCKTGSPSEYIRINETVSTEVLEVITKWLMENMGK